jgi:hypothetical protein
MAPLVLRFTHFRGENAFSEFFSKNLGLQRVKRRVVSVISFNLCSCVTVMGTFVTKGGKLPENSCHIHWRAQHSDVRNILIIDVPVFGEKTPII